MSTKKINIPDIDIEYTKLLNTIIKENHEWIAWKQDKINIEKRIIKRTIISAALASLVATSIALITSISMLML